VDAEAPGAREVPPTAVECARKFGVDVTLLLENLRLTPQQRLLKAYSAALSLAALRDQAERQRERARASGR